jgi:starch synthase (maltosyl-transferring)
MTGRIPILDVSPAIGCGRYPTRAVVGERIPIAATVFREGHDAVSANVAWRAPDGARRPFVRMTPGEPWTDRWFAEVVPDEPGRWTFTIEAWGDPYATWKHTVEVKIEAGQGPEDLANDLESGAQLLTKAWRFSAGERRGRFGAAVQALRDTALALAERVGPALDVADLLVDRPLRDLVTRSDTFSVWVDRERALYGSWYEFFPRSELTEDGGHGTFISASRRLDAIAEMGFDVVYLPPIHPIGRVNRKGPNNALLPGPDDPGSPWAIGSDDGGHDAVHPQLGTIDDFDVFVARARELGMEVALDLALQCAPDHPWVSKHPEWFTTKPDGSIAYAENPPKKYQDIYPLNFDNDPQGLYEECRRVVTYWIEHGVRIFRVDNPHTKPVSFWHWLIWRVKDEYPDVLFLAEAFTRSAMMHTLGKVGFTQSYTYFTWRTAKWELEQYLTELRDSADYMRPNLFVNTPDILHASLQYGGRPMFAIRAVLAAMLSPTWGMYSGFELFEHVAARPGSEEYLDSEKYQLRPRDWAKAAAEGATLAPYIQKLNDARRRHPALHQLRNLRFHHVDNDAITAFSKRDADTGDTVLVLVNLDPYHEQWGNTALDMPALGLDWHDHVRVTDELTGAEYDWGQFNAVRLDPYHEPAHVFTVRRYGW